MESYIVHRHSLSMRFQPDILMSVSHQSSVIKTYEFVQWYILWIFHCESQ